MVTTSERATIWTFGGPDDPDDEIGFLEEGEPVILLGQAVHWPNEESLSPTGHYMYRVLTRLGVGWVTDSELSVKPRRGH